MYSNACIVRFSYIMFGRTLPRLVRVFYEPPPFGPRTSLNRPGYGLGDGGTTPEWIVRISKMPAWQPIVAFCSAFCAIAYIPVTNQELPFTCSPEYQAASRAYMRYHNMNPVWGASSKQARAADEH